MKKALGILAILAVLSAAAAPLAAQNGEDAKFKKFQDTFWDTYFRFFPTAGTLAGFPKYMEKLEGFSEGAVWLAKLLARLKWAGADRFS